MALQKKGFNPGEADGVLRPRTRKALIAFQQQRGYKPTVNSITRPLPLLACRKVQVRARPVKTTPTRNSRSLAQRAPGEQRLPLSEPW
jgi:peptidoglycan hydrolase-like protein with peptidoglycan-binding domain